MASVLGKRKMRVEKEKVEIAAVSQEDAQAIFRRHFEAQFAPLEPASNAETTNEIEDLRSDSEEDGGSDDSWDGVSDSESLDPSGTTATEVVEVVTHTTAPPTLSNDPLAKRESKAYLSSRIPSSLLEPSSAATKPAAKSKAAADEDAPSLLKSDLELQRLLSESHLFGASENGNSIEHAGRNRHLATDLRLAALGSKASIFRQAKMPMAHRKGINAAAEARESKRRREARENGIVLERPSGGAAMKGGKVGGMRRSRGGGEVGAPAVGRLQNGMLKLSRKDIAEIQGDDRRGGGRGGGKKRRR